MIEFIVTEKRIKRYNMICSKCGKKFHIGEKGFATRNNPPIQYYCEECAYGKQV
jgi:hypothetical protein